MEITIAKTLAYKRGISFLTFFKERPKENCRIKKFQTENPQVC